MTSSLILSLVRSKRTSNTYKKKKKNDSNKFDALRREKIELIQLSSVRFGSIKNILTFF